MAKVNHVTGAWEGNVAKIRERVEDVRDRLEETTDRIKEKSEEAWKDAVNYVEKHPGQSIGVALVVGAALGVLLLGRRRD